MAEKQTDNENNIITYKIVCGVLGAILGILLTILGFFFSNWMNTLDTSNDRILKNTQEISQDLISLRLKITQIENKMLTVETVRMITKQQIRKYHDLHHPNVQKQ